MSPEDHALLEAAKGGDISSVEALIERHQPRVFRFAQKMCRRMDDAEDVLQETLLAAARSVGSFRGDASVSTWLYTIARSFCIKKARRSKFAPERELSLDDECRGEVRAIVDGGLLPDEQLETKRLGEALDRAIGSLDADHREVVLLRDVEGLTGAEVAEVTGLSVAAVKSRLHRARMELRDLLAPALPSPVSKKGDECRDIVPIFSRYLEGDIDARTCADMERHVDACSRCHGACESLKRVLRMCKETPAPEVPAALRESVRRQVRSLLASAD